VYIVALGGFGAKIIRLMYDLSLRPPPSMLEKLGIRDEARKDILMPNGEVQVIDMAFETDKHQYLIQEYDLNIGDHIKIIEFPPNEYDYDIIFKKTQILGYHNIARYWITTRDVISNLGPKQGVKRYRPLARYFVSLVANEIRNAIIDDYQEDFNMQPTINLFLASAGGGFGAGSLLTISSIAKMEGAPGTKNVLFLHLPIGSRYRLPINDTPFGEKNAYASMGMTILELMYVKELDSLGRPYKDNLTEFISRSMGLTREKEFTIKSFDSIIVSGMANLGPATNIEEEFELHDERFATIIMSTIAGLRSVGETIPIPILEDNPHVNAYLNSVFKIFREKDLPVTLAYPLEVYGIKYVNLNKKKVNELSTKLMKTIEAKESIEEELKTITNIINEKINELNGLYNRKNELLKEKAKIDEIEREDLKKVIREKIDKPELVNGINELEVKCSSIKQLIDQKLLGHASLLQGILNTRNRKQLSNARVIANDIAIGSGSLFTEVDQALKILDFLYTALPERIRKMEELDPIKGVVYLRLLDYLIIILHDLNSKLSAFKESISNIIADVQKFKRPIFCGPPCDIEKSLKGLPSKLTVIIERLNNMEQSLIDLRDHLEESVDFYKESLRKEVEKIEKKIVKLIKENRELEKEKINKEKKLYEVNNNLTANALEFIDNFISLFNKVGAMHIDLATRENIVKEITQNPQTFNKLKELLMRNEIRRLFESIEKSIDMLSEISNVAGEQLKISIVNALIDNIDNSITLTIDSPEMFAKAFNIDDPEVISKIDVKQYYIIYTPDNKELARAIRDRMQKVGKVSETEVVSDKSSFIGIIVKRLNVPLISIKEIRESIKHALSEHTNIVIDCNGETHESVISVYNISECTKRVKEYRGLEFSTLDFRSDNFKAFLDKVKEVITDYEKTLGI
jgi:hypothetical protein